MRKRSPARGSAARAAGPRPPARRPRAAARQSAEHQEAGREPPVDVLRRRHQGEPAITRPLLLSASSRSSSTPGRDQPVEHEPDQRRRSSGGSDGEPPEALAVRVQQRDPVGLDERPDDAGRGRRPGRASARTARASSVERLSYEFGRDLHVHAPPAEVANEPTSRRGVWARRGVTPRREAGAIEGRGRRGDAERRREDDAAGSGAGAARRRREARARCGGVLGVALVVGEPALHRAPARARAARRARRRRAVPRCAATGRRAASGRVRGVRRRSGRDTSVAVTAKNASQSRGDSVSRDARHVLRGRRRRAATAPSARSQRARRRTPQRAARASSAIPTFTAGEERTGSSRRGVARRPDVAPEVEPVGEARADQLGGQREQPEGEAGEKALVAARPLMRRS